MIQLFWLEVAKNNLELIVLCVVTTVTNYWYQEHYVTVYEFLVANKI